jgi:glucosamine--fructose-6-phosphate aminotransferase (isomerizing)
MVAKYWIEQLGRIPVEVDVASEFRYRNLPMVEGGLALFISQSGETMDTLSALRYAAAQQQSIVSIVNVPESTIARESHGVLRTLAGPEIGVASTKAFTTQLTVLAAFAIAFGRARGTLAEDKAADLAGALAEVPSRVTEVLAHAPRIAKIAEQLVEARDVLYLGRGTSYPIALEGALKLKEISYSHAEAYAAGELKHGPLALIDEDMPVVVVAPNNELLDKLKSNMQVVRARGGQLYVFADSETGIEPEDGVTVIEMPHADRLIAPIVYTVPLQLLAYHVAVLKGTDVDQPRNLAKSVTVE